MTKTYSSKSNAIRGFRSENPDCEIESLGEYVVQEAGRFFVELPADTVVIGEDEDPALCETCGHELASPNSDCHVADCEANPEYEPELDNEDGPAVGPLRPIKGTGSYKDVPLRRRTTDGGAVSWAWSVFDGMPAGTTRKAAISEAVRVGIAFYTARTQYQKWAHRNDPKPEGK